jgi:type II secretory pathway component PulF
MNEFAYEALMASGNVANGVMTAETEEELEANLRAMGHYLIRAEPIEAEERSGKVTDGKIPRPEMLAFLEYMWASTEAGIPILATLEDVEARMQHKRLRQILREIREQVKEEGLTLSESMAKHPKAFPALLIGTVAAGEASGRLDFALAQLVEYMEWQQSVTSTMRQATFYPVLLLCGMLSLVILLLGFVYPKLMPIFTGFGVELPLPTRVLMKSSEIFIGHWPMIVAGVVGVVVLTRLLVLIPWGRVAMDRFKLRMPLFGDLLRSIEMARFVTYMSLFYRTGIDLLQGLLLLQQILTNRAVVGAVAKARDGVAAGDSLAEAFSYTGLFPPLVIRGLALGETTGKLDEALGRAKVYYDREVPAAVNRMLTALQPLLILVMGALLLMVTLSIFLPILSIYNNLGNG